MKNQNYNLKENIHNYSENTGKVLYVPKETHHKIRELYDKKKYLLLVEEISNSGCNEELKELLIARAAQFCNFNFAKIADYYAYQASNEEQYFIEKLCLVLLDKDKLIEHGFADIMEDL